MRVGERGALAWLSVGGGVARTEQATVWRRGGGCGASGWFLLCVGVPACGRGRAAACALRGGGARSGVVLVWFWRGFGVVLRAKDGAVQRCFFAFFGVSMGDFWALFWGWAFGILGANNGLVLGAAVCEFGGWSG